MKFFSKIVFVFNIGFLLALTLRYFEQMGTSGGSAEILKEQPVVATILVLYLTSVFVNLLFVMGYVFRLSLRKPNTVPTFILLFNLLLFPFQVYYFFLS